MVTPIAQHRGRPRTLIDATLARRLRNECWTLDEIAQRLACGRGTVARALARVPTTPEPPLAPRMPVAERASELARSRADSEPHDGEQRRRMREHARHLVHCRWGDGMRVEGQDFKPAGPKSEGPRWLGVALMAGGLLLWAVGCPAPL